MASSERKDWNQNQPPIRQWLIIIGVVGLVLCLLAALLFFALQTFNTWNDSRLQLATETAATATAAVAEQYDRLQGASTWRLVLLERFDDNQHDWIEGPVDDAYAQIEVSIDGEYVWDAVAKQGFIWRVWPVAEDLVDFYLAVDVRNAGDNPDMQYGLIFRNIGEAYYYFEVRDSGAFRLYLMDNGEWIELIPSTSTPAIRAGETNRLEVVSWGVHYALAINGEIVGTLSDTNLSLGKAGLIIGLESQGESGLIIFDNFEIRTR